MHTDEQTAGDTLGEIGKAVKKDAETTKDHVEEATDWVKEKADDAKKAVKEEAHEHGV